METTNQDSEDRALQPVDSENQHPIETEREVTVHRSWPTLLALAIAALAFAILVVLGGRFVYHKLHHNVTPAPAQTKDLPKPPTGAASSGGSSTSGTNKQLVDSGPGDTVAIFAASSFAAASLHYIVSLRKQTQS